MKHELKLGMTIFPERTTYIHIWGFWLTQHLREKDNFIFGVMSIEWNAFLRKVSAKVLTLPPSLLSKNIRQIVKDVMDTFCCYFEKKAGTFGNYTIVFYWHAL